MGLTNSQQEAADKLITFLLSQEEELVLTSGAGYGKTHLISWFVNEGYSRYLQICAENQIPVFFAKRPIVTATTNKAAEVLSTKLGVPADTIHSYLGVVVKEDYATGTNMPPIVTHNLPQNMKGEVDLYSLLSFNKIHNDKMIDVYNKIKELSQLFDSNAL